MALPAYQDYTVRSCVSESLVVASAAKAQVQVFLAGGNFRADAAGYASGFNAPAATTNLSGVTIAPDTT